MKLVSPSYFDPPPESVLLFNSFNEIWFSASVSGPLAVTSAVGAGNLFVSTQRWIGPLIAWIGAILLGIALAIAARKAKQPTVIIAGTVLVLVFIAVPGRLLGVGSNQIGILDNGIRNEWFDIAKANRIETIDQTNVIDWTSEKMEAAATLREITEPQDVIATNLTLGPFVAGVTHLPTYVSAIIYQNDYAPAWVSAELPKREKAVWDFIDNPDQSTSGVICQGGVRWLWIDKGRTQQRGWEPIASSVFENDEVTLAQVNRSICS